MLIHYKWFYELLIWMPPTLLAISWREAVKAWVYNWREHSTSNRPLKASFDFTNLDPIGSAIAPVLLILAHSYVYGWAKPADIRANNLKKGIWDVALILFAAFAANFLMAAGWAWVAKFALHLSKTNPHLSEALFIASEAGVQVNILLISIHLLPLPPLDMSYLVRVKLGKYSRYAESWYTYIDPVGQIALFILLLFKIAQPFIHPLYLLVLEQLHLFIGF